jgi:hypothetical protein
LFFWQNEDETPLIEAILKDEIEKVRKLKDQKDHVLAKNYLGFNAIEMAKYLDKSELHSLLETLSQKIFKVKPSGSDEIVDFSEDKFQKFFNFRYLRHLIFDNYSIFKEVIRSCAASYRDGESIEEKVNPEIFEKYFDKTEKFALRTRLFENKINSGYIAPMTIEWIDEMVGYGIFAAQDFKKGEYIGEYTGVVRRRAWGYWIYQNEYSITYPNHTMRRFCVDGQGQGNELRFSNHSYNPTMEPVVADDKGLLHSLFIAKRNISMGEQLTWDYGEDFWSIRNPPQEL